MGIGLTSVFSLKGGVGKTSLSLSMCLEMEFNHLDVSVISNDPVSIIEKVLGDGKGWILPQNKNFPSEINTEDDFILDLGGFLEKRIIEVIEKSKNVIIPTTPDYASLQATIKTLNDVKKLNENVVLVVNRIDKKEFMEIYEVLRDACGPYPVFPIKNSKSFENLQRQRKSISQMMVDEPVRKKAYGEVQKQIEKIIEHLKGE